MAKRPRRRCKICREWFYHKFPNEWWFYHKFPNEWWCCPEHGAEYRIMLREKQKLEKEQQRKKEAQQERRAEKVRLKARINELKPLSHFHRLAQVAFNAFIRERDYGMPCISCGRSTGAKMNAGHYRTVGASKETRYDETNCHIQCEHCNSYLSGNIGEYTPRLIEKIGQEAFDRLIGPHLKRKWTREELQALAKHYREKTKALQKERGEAA